MIAVDTNVLVRIITWDDDVQANQAKQLLSSGPIFISLIAILETEWVLRSSHGFSAADVSQALTSMFALPNIIVEQWALVRWALERHNEGADLGDTLLLISARDADSFSTFDRRLPKRAGNGSPVPINLITS